MPDFLDILAQDALKTIGEGYYETFTEAQSLHLSLRKVVLQCKKTAIISEIKFFSPSLGVLRKNGGIAQVVGEMEEGGAAGISVLTEPKHFRGRPEHVAEARKKVNIPILMKDIILSRLQIDAAYRTGADAILLIQTLFDRGYCDGNVQDFIDFSHSKGLEVLLEVHTRDEFISALKTTADLIGVNNRDLGTLKVNLDTIKRVQIGSRADNKVIVAESGISSADDIRLLRKMGVKAFLVGTAVMKAECIKI
ncbi:indole-3-glycerol-phosphate synthase, partial [Candidatus Bathyarchaeota archaeon]|nr:indole-3-glycerol-phosphate synthase [Candidatus Bathyarchaeota archaeon]